MAWGIHRTTSEFFNLDERNVFKLPATWNYLNHTQFDSPAFGVATFYSQIQLTGNPDKVFFKLPDTPSAAELWVNNRLIISQGVIADNGQGEQPDVGPQFGHIENPSKTLDVLLIVSNFHYKEGGIWSPVVVTSEHGEFNLVTLPLISDVSLTLFMFVLSLSFISLYIARRQEKTALFFSTFCILIALRNGFTGEHFLNDLLPFISWINSQRIEHIAFFLSTPLFISFTEHLYPRYKLKHVTRAISAIAILFSLTTLFTPAAIFTELAIPFQLVVILCSLYVIRFAVFALKHGRESAAIFAFGCLSLFIPVILDVLTHNMILELPILSEWGVATFLFCQAWLLNQRYANSLSHVESMSSKLKQQNEQFQQLDMMKDDFLAQTSHELRTPIHGISALTELVLQHDDKLDERSQENLKLIHSSSQRLSNLVNDILDLSSIKNKHIKLQPTAFALTPLLELVISNLRPLLKARPITLSCETDALLPKVMADESRIQQVLFNLIGNAIKFTLEGEINVRVEARENQVMVTVADTGIGIDNTILDQLFQPYKQGQQGMFTNGHGLGLTITRNLLDLHQSELKVKSIPGHGSTFSFELEAATHLPDSVVDITSPNEERNTERRAEQRKPSDRILNREISVTEADISSKSLSESNALTSNNTTSTEATSTSAVRDALLVSAAAYEEKYRFHIWAVDDEPVNLQVLENQVNDLHYHCTTFSSGVDMLEALSSNEQPDLILLDVMMPLMNGFEVCGRIRQHFNNLELPVIIVTARQQPQDILKAFEAGANDYLAKPYNFQELKARVAAQLNSILYYNVSQDNDALLQEVAHRQQLEKMMADRNDLLLTAFNNSKPGFLVLNAEFGVEYQNSSMIGFTEVNPRLSANTEGNLITQLITDQQAEIQERSHLNTTINEGELHYRINLHAFDVKGNMFYSALIEEVSQLEKGVTTSSSDTKSADQLALENRLKVLEDLLISQPGYLTTDSNIDDNAEHLTEQKGTESPEDDKLLTARNNLVDATRLSLRLWESYTGKGKADLAEKSNIWRVYIDGGTVKTRTLDKYLSEKTMPKKPRWRSVVKTLHFILSECQITEAEENQLNDLIKTIEKEQLA